MDRAFPDSCWGRPTCCIQCLFSVRVADCADVFQSWSSSWADIRSPLSHLSSTVSCEMLPTTAFKVVICDTTAATSPHLYSHCLLSSSMQRILAIVLYVARSRFTFPATAVMLGVSILLLSTVDPTGTGGHRDPQQGIRCLVKLATNLSPSTPPFCFPYFPLVTLYLFLFDFLLSLPFPFGVF